MRKLLRGYDRAGLRESNNSEDLYDSLLEGLWAAVQVHDGNAARLGRAVGEVASSVGFAINDEGAQYIGLDLASWWDTNKPLFHLD